MVYSIKKNTRARNPIENDKHKFAKNFCSFLKTLIFVSESYYDKYYPNIYSDNNPVWENLLILLLSKNINYVYTVYNMYTMICYLKKRDFYKEIFKWTFNKMFIQSTLTFEGIMFSFHLIFQFNMKIFLITQHILFVILWNFYQRVFPFSFLCPNKFNEVLLGSIFLIQICFFPFLCILNRATERIKPIYCGLRFHFALMLDFVCVCNFNWSHM